MTDLMELQEDLDELGSAEEFLEYFEIQFNKRVVQINRLHILQRFHDYLNDNPLHADTDPVGHYRHWLARAYGDFVGSSAQEQKALKVFKAPEPAFVSLDEFGV